MLPSLPDLPPDPLFDPLSCTPSHQWHASTFSEISDRLEQALGLEDPTELRDLTRRLQALLRRALAQSPDEVKSVLLEQGEDIALKAAYHLGQLAFAQQMAASTLMRRPDKEFNSFLRDPVIRRLMQALGEDELSKVELAKRLQQMQTTTNQQLRTTTRVGLTDFRSDSGEARYFLTPAARALLEVPLPA